MLDFSNIQIGKKYDRPWLALHWGFAGYEAISRGVFCPRGGGQIILFVTRIKQESLEQYNDYISGEYLFWEGEKGMETIAGLQTLRGLVKTYICSFARFITHPLSTKV